MQIRVIRRNYLYTLIAVLALCFSGNFSEFKLFSATPIQLLLILYLMLNIKALVRAKTSQPIMLFILYILAVIILGYINFRYSLTQDIKYFSGALDPFLYFLLSFIRVIMLILIVYLIANKIDVSSEHEFVISFTKIAFYTLSVSVILQALLSSTNSVTYGFMYFYGDQPRYGSFFGEPQTLQSWITSAFVSNICLASRLNQKHIVFKKKFLAMQLIHILSLYLTSSTVWIFATFVFYTVIAFRFRLVNVIIFIGVGFFIALVLMNKIVADLLTVSERSITILAGAEIYLLDIYNVLFGYGLGMSPYLIIGTNWFENYSIFLMSDFGRQIVMNSFLGLLFEVGILAVLPITLYSLRILMFGRHISATFLAGFVGTLSIGNGFWAPSFILILVAMLLSIRTQD